MAIRLSSSSFDPIEFLHEDVIHENDINNDHKFPIDDMSFQCDDV